MPILLVFKASWIPLPPSSPAHYSTSFCYGEYRIIYLQISRSSNAGCSLLMAAAKSKSKNSEVVSHLASCPRMKTAIRQWKMMNGRADEHTVGYLMRQISAIAQTEGSCQCVSKSKIYVHHLRAHTPISYLGLSPL